MDKVIRQKFDNLWRRAQQGDIAGSTLSHVNAVCISTVDEQGFPQSRFVDLKEMNERGFIFCSALTSKKAQQLSVNPKIALTIWWQHIGIQIRVVGLASVVSNELSDQYWSTRSLDAQLATVSFEQSQPWHKAQSMDDYFDSEQKNLLSTSIPRPTNWGGYLITPISIEFLTFKTNRVHLRELYTKQGSEWQQSLLQP